MRSQSHSNRDVTRQNKATSVVKATMLSLQCAECIIAISELISKLKDDIQLSSVSGTYNDIFDTLHDLISISSSTYKNHFLTC